MRSNDRDSGRLSERHWRARHAVSTPMPSFLDMNFHEVPAALSAAGVRSCDLFREPFQNSNSNERCVQRLSRYLIFSRQRRLLLSGGDPLTNLLDLHRR